MSGCWYPSGRSLLWRSFLELAVGPAGVIFPFVGSIEFGELFVTRNGVELDVKEEFAQADGAKVLRAEVGFVEVVGAVHQAIEVDAVVQAEHVAGFVSKDFTAALQDDLAIIFVSFTAKKGRVVASEAVDADPFGERGLAKNVVPRFGRVEVFHGDAEKAVGVDGKKRFQVVENRKGVKLAFLGAFVDSGTEQFFVECGRRKNFYVELEKGLGVEAQVIEMRAGIEREISQREEVDDIASGVGAVETGGAISTEGLANFFMRGKPIAEAGCRDWREVGVGCEQALKKGGFVIERAKGFDAVESGGRFEGPAGI